MDFQQACKEVFCEVKAQHIGPIGLGDGGVGVSLHEDAIASYRHGRTANGANHPGVASGDAGRLVGVLEGMGDIDHNRYLIALHLGYPTEIDHEVLIAESGAALGKHDVGVAKMAHFVDSMDHGPRGEELPLLDVDATARNRGGLQQGSLPAEEGRNLQHINIGRRQGGILLAVNVGDHGDAIAVGNSLENFQSLAVTDTCERIDTGAVGLAIGGFERVGNVEPLGDGHQPLGDKERALVVLYHTGTGNQKEVAGLCIA